MEPEITQEEFAKLFYLMAKSKLIKVEADMLMAWYELLKKYPTDKLERAFWALIKSPDGFPSVGKIIEIVEDEKSSKELAVSAYNYAYNIAKNSYGKDEKMDTPDPYIDGFVKTNFQGWKNFWNNCGDAFYRKEFLRVFEMKWKRKQKDDFKALPIEKMRLIG